MPFPIGAHFYVRRLFYTHHGIYIGDNRVIHYAGWHKSGKKGKVEEVVLSEFANGGKPKLYPLENLLRGKRLPANEIINEAKSW
nr:lecithin retinol acyltransferase family protein [Brevibacillus migulae]